MQEKGKILVGVAVLLFNEQNCILLGKRKSAHGYLQWAPPGGHLQYGETPFACAYRELLEETGASLSDPLSLGYTNDIFFENEKQYITLFITGNFSGTIAAKEPDKCQEWFWVNYAQLPQDLFLPFYTFVQLRPTIESIKKIKEFCAAM